MDYLIKEEGGMKTGEYLISIEIHKRPWQAGDTIKPKAPWGTYALENYCFDIIYVLVTTFIESDKKMENNFDL
jgi:hypothetical protein